MDIQITGRHLEMTDALKTFTNEKMEKLLKFHQDIIKAEVILQIENVTQIAEANVFFKSFEIHGKSEASDMYAAIDLLVDKLLAQISKHKDKMIDKQHHR